ncbi:cellulose synthase subunit BcsC-related outer membrane protein [Gayadomonas joobiniege]|uniref:cellulose synthase subunit BcsC-related outer membrane protein n=1 Tax=Gayadomonas joobiniege TaxID=1234606 RepID=UPI0003720BFB|nr:cellulose synthase subunit BcsC-related outer membrane protein [Gayadomonas joobiniege]
MQRLAVGLFFLAISLRPLCAAVASLDKTPASQLQKQIEQALLQDHMAIALDALHKLSAIAPHQPYYLCAQISVQLAQGELLKARQTLAQLNNIAARPDCHPDAVKLLELATKHKAQVSHARLLAKSKRPIEAIAIYDQLFENRFPSLSYQLDYYAWLAQTDYDTEKLIKAYQQLQNKYPNVAEIELPLASLILDIDPFSQQAIDILARYAHSPRYGVRTEDIWLAEINSMPVRPAGQHIIEQYLAYFPKSKKGEFAIENFTARFTQYQKNLKDPAFVAWQKGQQLSDSGKLKQAQYWLNKAIIGRPNDAQVQASMGLLKIRLGKHKNARKYLNKALSLAPADNNSSLWYSLLDTANYWSLIEDLEAAIAQGKVQMAKVLFNKLPAEQQTLTQQYFYQGEIARIQQQTQVAMQHYQKSLAEDSESNQALYGLLKLIEQNQNIELGWQIYRQLPRARQQQIYSDFASQMSSLYRTLTEQQIARGQPQLARALLKDATSRLIGDPWLTYDLAKLYQNQQQDTKGLQLFANGLPKTTQKTEYLLAYTLFLSSLGHYQKAIDLLKKHQPDSEQIQALQKSLQQQKYLAELEELRGNTRLNHPQLVQLQTLSGQMTTPLEQARLGQIWYQNGYAQKGIQLLKQALNNDNTLDAYWHFEYIEWQLHQNNHNEVKNAFANIELNEQMTTSDVRRWLALKTAWYQKNDVPLTLLSQQLVQQAAKAPELYTVKQALAELYINQQQVPELWPLLSELHQTQKLSDELAINSLSEFFLQMPTKLKKNLFAQLKRPNSSLTEDQQAELIQILSTTPNRQDLTFVSQLVDNTNSDLVRYRAAEYAVSLNEQNKAQQWLTQIQTRPESPLWFHDQAERLLNEQRYKQQAWVAVGLQSASQRQNSDGKRITSSQIPFELWYPLWDGHVFVKLDYENVQDPALTLVQNEGISNFATGLFCRQDCPNGEYQRSQSGTDVAIGFQNKRWRFDLGVSPLGFEQHDLLFGIRYENDWRSFGYSVEFERRAVDNSALSYSGLIDPYTGELFGAVRATGASIVLSKDEGQTWGHWALANAYSYRGQQVASNFSYSLMGGSYYRLAQNTEFTLTIGTNLLHWSYNKDLSGETLGHGGYYSPQSYWGLSLPLDAQGQLNKLSYQLSLGLSWSQSQSDEIEYYPTDKARQQAAEALIGESFVEPVYRASNSQGIGYSARAAVEYQIDQHWVVGGVFSIQRANAYEPTEGQVYLRYYFNDKGSRLFVPPEPIQPYQSFY